MRARTLPQFKDLIGNNIRRKIKLPMIERAEIRFNQALDALIEEIETHPISQELIEHTHPSKFLRGSPGSLFGFFGFNEGDEPIEDLLEYLRGEIEMRPGARVDAAFRLPLNISLPNKRDFNDDGRFKLPWGAGLSWVVAIEVGLSGLPHFLTVTHRANKGESRSQEGLQVKSKISNQGYQGKSYLSQAFSNFRRRLLAR